MQAVICFQEGTTVQRICTEEGQVAAFIECLEERRKSEKALKATASSGDAEEEADDPEQKFVKKS